MFRFVKQEKKKQKDKVNKSRKKNNPLLRRVNFKRKIFSIDRNGKGLKQGRNIRRT